MRFTGRSTVLIAFVSCCICTRAAAIVAPARPMFLGELFRKLTGNANGLSMDYSEQIEAFMSDVFADLDEDGLDDVNARQFTKACKKRGDTDEREIAVASHNLVVLLMQTNARRDEFKNERKTAINTDYAGISSEARYAGGTRGHRSNRGGYGYQHGSSSRRSMHDAAQRDRQRAQEKKDLFANAVTARWADYSVPLRARCERELAQIVAMEEDYGSR